MNQFSRRTRALFCIFALVGSMACSGKSESPLISISPSQPVENPGSGGQDVESMPANASTLNHIEGQWRLTYLKTQRGDQAMQYLKNIYNQGSSSVSLDVDETSATLQLAYSDKSPSDTCKFSIKIPLAYCCPKMRRIFVGKDTQAYSIKRIERPSGCAKKAFELKASALEETLLDALDAEYHFTYKAKYLKLTGPYKDSTTELRFVPSRPEK